MFNANKCELTQYPAPVLGKPCQPVEQIDDNLRDIVDRMGDIMVAAKGIGLAGPQAGLPLRIFIISLTGAKKDARVYINSIVTPTTDEIDTHEEGCLSIPGVYTRVRRFRTCTVTATDLDGHEFTEDADGLYARALQHEYDHIEGMTIADRMATTARIAHRRQLKRLEQQYDENP